MTIIRVVDVETTGLDDPAEMVEVGWTDVVIGSAGQIVIDPHGPHSRLVKPGLPISYPAMAVHHITEAEVMHGADPDECRDIIASGADILCAHNAAFDSRFIHGHNLPWICTFKAAKTIWPDLQGHSNGSIRYERGLCLHDARALPSHRAGPDTWVTAHILVDLLAEVSVERLIEITKNPVLQRKISFGQHAGELWAEVPDSYLDWILNKSNMPTDPKREDEVFTARSEMIRRYPPQTPPSIQGKSREDTYKNELETERQDAGRFENVEPDACTGKIDSVPNVIRTDSDGETTAPELKGGRLAQRAGIICAEGAFWRFIGELYRGEIASANGAAAWLRLMCGVESRRQLDSDAAAGAEFEKISKQYAMWMEGY